MKKLAYDPVVIEFFSDRIGHADLKLKQPPSYFIMEIKTRCVLFRIDFCRLVPYPSQMWDELIQVKFKNFPAKDAVSHVPDFWVI